MLTNQHAIAQQPLMHGPGEALSRAAMHGQIRRWEITGKKLHLLRHNPIRCCQAQAGMRIIGGRIDMRRRTRIQRENIARTQQRARGFQMFRLEQAIGWQIKAPDNTGTIPAFQRHLFHARSIAEEMAGRIHMCAGMHHHLKARHRQWIGGQAE